MTLRIIAAAVLFMAIHTLYMFRRARLSFHLRKQAFDAQTRAAENYSSHGEVFSRRWGMFEG